ncbi:C2 domain-containing protein [Strongyloides ratti]|uniref:C2 domain-containing protein n=1 Tax=Strongyloides ratti TaxID=34506 RepID=A0A090LBL3_STRRB|nr:C2 domain-containing protein [Strongyloides ratti]CEF64920.1 C2 domain-containing protein [Strongyloides ratti]
MPEINESKVDNDCRASKKSLLLPSFENNTLEVEKNRSRIRSFSVFDQKSASLRQQDYSLNFNNSLLNVPGMARSNSIMLSPHHHPPEHRRLPHSPYDNGIPSSTNNRGSGYSHHFHSPSVSHNGSYLDVRSSLNSSNSSLASSLHPSGGRRKLPIAPDEISSGGIDGFQSPRRCSSPRLLPTSPCISPMANSPSPPYQFNNYQSNERRSSGRRLPEPPAIQPSYNHPNKNNSNNINNVPKINNYPKLPTNSSIYSVDSITPSTYTPPSDISMDNFHISSNNPNNDLLVRRQLPMKKTSCIIQPTTPFHYTKHPRRNSTTQPSLHINQPTENIFPNNNDNQIQQQNLLPNPFGITTKPITKSESTLTGTSTTTSSNEPSRRSSIVQDRDAFRFRNGSMAHLFEQQHLIQIRDKSPSRTSTYTLESQYSTDQLNSISSAKSRGSVDKEEDGNISVVGSISSSGSAVATSENRKPENLGLDPSHYIGKENKPEVVVLSASGQRVLINEDDKPKGLGLVTCTLQHFPIRKRLRVTVIKVEGLAGELKPNLEILPFCRVTLHPGKSTKSQDSVVKRGRDAVFNQEFFFDNVTIDDLDTKYVQVVFLHQSSQKLQKDIEIGEFNIELKDFPLLHDKKEVKIVDELKVKFNTKKLGKIYFSTQISKEGKTLTINVNKVEDLPKWGLIGAPDVCVRVTVIQEENKVQTKQSRVLKNTCKAVYQESIMFLISTKMNDLRKTQIIVSAIDMQRDGIGDSIIGSAYLGAIAMDKSEIDQWKNTIEHIGKEYKASHHLKLEQPEVKEYIENDTVEKNETKKELGIDDFDEWLK